EGGQQGVLGLRALGGLDGIPRPGPLHGRGGLALGHAGLGLGQRQTGRVARLHLVLGDVVRRRRLGGDLSGLDVPLRERDLLQLRRGQRLARRRGGGGRVGLALVLALAVGLVL